MALLVLVVVTGPSASGKTTIARKISAELGWPLIGKDTIKELLFDNIGWKDREWSRTMGKATYRLMDYFAETLLDAKQSLILEADFRVELDSQRLVKLAERFGAKLVQVYCTADKEVLKARFRVRQEGGQRHPGHIDDQNTALFDDPNFAKTFAPLELDATLIRADTTGPGMMDVELVAGQIRQIIKQ